MNLETQVVVIGGGVTGTGVLRDLARRGVNGVLFERGNLASGTTGNFHGLLHSGGRYAVTDPEAAAECIQENQILRRIAPQAIEDTGGFFLVMDEVDDAWLPRLLEGCGKAGIPTEVVSADEARRLEPELSPAVRCAVSVPDGSVDGYTLCQGNLASAKPRVGDPPGRRAYLFTRVVEILREGDRVVGVRAVDQTNGDEYRVRAEIVVNAAGVWCGQIAQLAGVPLKMSPNKGTMLALDGRPVKRAINRCRKPGDGDIIVPVGSTIVLGTTSVNVPDPDSARAEEWEIYKIIEEGTAMVPAVANLRMQKAYVGVRPLYRPPTVGGEVGDPRGSEIPVGKGREISRGFHVLDHAKLDSVEGLVSIVGGKLTSFRLMAEKTTDMVCAKLGVTAACRTAVEPLPVE